jgi:hypothetical protein
VDVAKPQDHLYPHNRFEFLKNPKPVKGYEENIKLAQAVNVSGEVEYVFPHYRLLNISG